jgi:dienelactone hydrolase
MLYETPVVFISQGAPLVGRLVRNTESLTERQPAIVVTGSWLTVKEQMPLLYARRLAERGFTTFAFDFTGFGASGGGLRQAEIPSRKIKDIDAVARFVKTLGVIRPDRIGHLAVCASAQYVLAAVAAGAPIDSLVSVAGWFHDPATVAPLYGGEEQVRRRIQLAVAAVEHYAATGEVLTVPAYRPGDDNAGMSLELDYYGNPQRGAIPSWKNEMAVMSWWHWLTFDGLKAAPSVSVPVQFVHGDGCMLPGNVKAIASRLKGESSLLWMGGFQVDFYDQPHLVAPAVEAAVRHFTKTL